MINKNDKLSDEDFFSELLNILSVPSDISLDQDIDYTEILVNIINAIAGASVLDAETEREFENELYKLNNMRDLPKNIGETINNYFLQKK